MVRFSPAAFKEFLPCRCIEEEVADLDSRSPVGGLLLLPEFPAFDVDGVAKIGVAGGGGYAETGDRGYRGQCLSPEPHGGYIEEVFHGADLACCMGLKAQQEVLPRHTGAVVAYTDQFAAAVQDIDADGFGPCIYGVFGQFLYNRCGTLNHLTCGYPVSEIRWENLNLLHYPFYPVTLHNLKFPGEPTGSGNQWRPCGRTAGNNGFNVFVVNLL
ncbi:hypothetical protein BMS3Abin08_00028 [bacterium BMS3Abin08]|nr:hypothetical protein BMS3Abin08_00028 [bacterium BMS3Abin08]